MTGTTVVFISVISAPRHDKQELASEIISNRCNNIRLCNRSLDGETLHLQSSSRVGYITYLRGVGAMGYAITKYITN